MASNGVQKRSLLRPTRCNYTNDLSSCAPFTNLTRVFFLYRMKYNEFCVTLCQLQKMLIKRMCDLNADVTRILFCNFFWFLNTMWVSKFNYFVFNQYVKQETKTKGGNLVEQSTVRCFKLVNMQGVYLHLEVKRKKRESNQQLEKMSVQISKWWRHQNVIIKSENIFL